MISNLISVIEQFLSPVSVVHVPVDEEHPPVRGDGPDRRVVHQAEARGAAAARVVSGRPHHARARYHHAVTNRLHSLLI